MKSRDLKKIEITPRCDHVHCRDEVATIFPATILLFSRVLSEAKVTGPLSRLAD